MGDEYWYPLYEKLVELDVPAHIHATGNRYGRGTYSTHFIDEESLAIALFAKGVLIGDVL